MLRTATTWTQGAASILCRCWRRADAVHTVRAAVLAEKPVHALQKLLLRCVDLAMAHLKVWSIAALWLGFKLCLCRTSPHLSLHEQHALRIVARQVALNNSVVLLSLTDQERQCCSCWSVIAAACWRVEYHHAHFSRRNNFTRVLYYQPRQCFASS